METAEKTLIASRKPLFTLTIFYIMGGLFIVLSLALATYVLGRMHQSAQIASARTVPQIQAVHLTKTALTDAHMALVHVMVSDQPASLDYVLQQKAAFWQNSNKADTLLSAITWGSESEAFAKTAGGINRIEWKRLGYSEQFRLEPASESQARLAGYTGLNYAGLVNNADKAISYHEQYLRLQLAGSKVEAAKAEASANASFDKSTQFFEQAFTATTNLESELIQEGAKQSAYANHLWRVSRGALLLLAALGFVGSVIVGLLFTWRYIITPLATLQAWLGQIAGGKLSSLGTLTVTGPLSALTASFNATITKLQHEFGSLHAEIQNKDTLLAKQTKTYEDTKQAMINLLNDARTLEEELKAEKTSVEEKVVERTQQLQKEQARLAASVNSLSAGFIMTNDKEQVVIINPIARAILFDNTDLKHGENPKLDQIQKSMHDQLDFKSQIKHCLTTKTTVAIPEILFNNSFLRLNFAPIIDTDGNAIGTVVLIQDITEEKVVQRSKDEFFSIASHELRTPLTAIRGNTTMIQQYYKEIFKDPELKEIIDDVHNSSVRLIEIVNDFLDASRLEQGKVEFKLERFNIGSIVESVVYEMGAISQEKHITISQADNLGTLPDVYADQDRVKQIIYNLVGNAMKFTEKGGITVSAKPEGSVLKIFVEDTGKGIPADKQILLFHKFQQAGDNLYTRDTTRGTGLGLYISKLLVEKMGGKINLEKSAQNKGSAFSFTLPLATDKK